MEHHPLERVHGTSAGKPEQQQWMATFAFSPINLLQEVHKNKPSMKPNVLVLSSSMHLPAAAHKQLGVH